MSELVHSKRSEQPYAVESEQGVVRRKGGNGERVFVLSARAFAILVKNARSNLGTDANSVLYEMGEYYGSSFGYSIRRLSPDYNSAIRTVSQVATESGWGKFSIFGNFEKGEDLIVKVDDCVFCSTRPKSTSKPSCHFLRGIVRGVSKAIYERSFKAVETLCIASGDVCCSFVLVADPNPVEEID